MIDLSEWEDYKISNQKVNSIGYWTGKSGFFGLALLKQGLDEHIRCGTIIKEDVDRAKSLLSL